MESAQFDIEDCGGATAEGEFQACNLPCVGQPEALSVAGLFAGVGGIELGLHQAGARTELLCENWAPASAVLRERFAGVPIVGDIRDLGELPDVDLVTAGFPCTDLSQAGKTAGITGAASGLVDEVFRLLRGRRVPLLLLENVRNMLVLDRGRAMRHLVDELEALGYRWAYRLVDSRFTGVPQRRQRVIFLASQDLDPREVLFADEAGEPHSSHFREDAFGFYWTEGSRGLGWAQDAVPTLKAGSALGIPSPPAIWNPAAELGLRVVTPTVEDAEKLQGLPTDWTSASESDARTSRHRWKMIGNAVTVGVAKWVGERVLAPGPPRVGGQPQAREGSWPQAGYGENGSLWCIDISPWPRREPYVHLANQISLKNCVPLSAKASSGFYRRTQKSSLRFQDKFIEDISEHVKFMANVNGNPRTDH